MNRLQKKFLVASLALHALLCVILVVGPAFLSSKQKDLNLPILEVVPDRLTDEQAYGGGNPNAKPPPASRADLTPLPPPVQPTKPIEPAPTPAKTKPPPDKVKDLEPKREAVERKAEKSKPQIKVDDRIVKRSPNKTPEKTTTKSEADDAKAQARAEAEARRRTAKQILAALNGASERLENLSSTTKVEPLGPGGAAFANYGQAVKTIYERNWIKPAQIEETEVVKTTVVIARNGRVVSFKIIRRSGNSPVDRSVEQVLEAVTELPPFPEGSTDETRTFDIDFELKPNRLAG